MVGKESVPKRVHSLLVIRFANQLLLSVTQISRDPVVPNAALIYKSGGSSAVELLESRGHEVSHLGVFVHYNHDIIIALGGLMQPSAKIGTYPGPGRSQDGWGWSKPVGLVCAVRIAGVAMVTLKIPLDIGCEARSKVVSFEELLGEELSVTPC